MTDTLINPNAVVYVRPSTDPINPDVALAYALLRAKQPALNKYIGYYEGRMPLPSVAARLEEVFGKDAFRVIQNWTRIVVKSVTDRLVLRGFQINGAGYETAQTTLNTLWNDLDLELEADDAHDYACAAGEAFIIAWPGPDDTTDVCYNDPRLVVMVYEDSNPKRKRFAAKWWNDSVTKRRRLTLYYADRLEYYQSVDALQDDGTLAQDKPGFELYTDDDNPDPMPENPYGIVPVFHYRPVDRNATSELAPAIGPQDGVNMLYSNMLVASEFAALPQKWIISTMQTDELKSKPNGVWWLPGGDMASQPTTAGQFQAASLDPFLKALEQTAGTIGVLTSTPKHYFFLQGGDPSGEALNAMEAPLVKKVKKRIARLNPTWRDLAAFLLKLNGIDIPETAIQPVFDSPETVQPKTNAETREIIVRGGVPLITALRDEGWSEARIDQMLEDKAREAASVSGALANTLLAQTTFDQGGG